MRISLITVFFFLSGLGLAQSMTQARTLLSAGRPGEALEVYEVLKTRGRDDAHLWYGIARAQFALDRLVLTVAACDLALLRDSRHQGALSLRARAREAQHRFYEAIRDYEAALTLSPENAYLAGRLGYLYSRVRRPEESYRYYRRAAELPPPAKARLIQVAWAAFKLEELLEAEKWLERARLAGASQKELESLAPLVQIRLADRDRRAGELEAAQARLANLVKDWPDSDQAETARQQIAALDRLDF